MNAEFRTCLLCRQKIDPEAVRRTTIQVKLHGAFKYAVCVACSMEVPKPWTTSYKRAWTQRRKKNLERYERSIKLARNKVKTGEWRKV